MAFRSERTLSKSWQIPFAARLKPRQWLVLLHSAAQMGRDGAGVSDSGPAENTSSLRTYEAPASSTQLRRSAEDGRRRSAEDGRRRNAEDGGSTAIAAGVGGWSERGPMNLPRQQRAVLTPSPGRRCRSIDKAVDCPRHV